MFVIIFVTQASFKPEEVVFEQGDKGTVFYVVLEGTASVLIDIDGDGDETEVAKITAGGYFGERALLKDEPRAATIQAQTLFKVMSITRAKFEEILGPLSVYVEKAAGYARAGAAVINVLRKVAIFEGVKEEELVQLSESMNQVYAPHANSEPIPRSAIQTEKSCTRSTTSVLLMLCVDAEAMTECLRGAGFL
jgi:hypothetical protein